MANEPSAPQSINWPLARDKDIKILPERLLFETVERMEAHRDGRVAVHIHLSKLQQQYRKSHYLRIATDAFEAQVKAYTGHIFVLGNQDLFFIGKALAMTQLIDAVDRLRLLFAEDPLTRYGNGEEEQGSFATYYDFKANYELIYQDVLVLYKAAERLNQPKDPKDKKEIKTPNHGKLFQPQDLSKLITLLERADLTNIMRRQTACVLSANGIPVPLFQETYISIDDLQKICTPDTDLLSDRWLFHYLTRTLDKRILSLMAGAINPDMPFSLNLNIETLLSPEFRQFDDRVPVRLRGKMVIELHKVDVFSDIGAYLFARDYVRERGYLLCLDGLTHHTLPFFDKNKLGLDLYKIYWGPEGLKTAQPSALAGIKNVLSEFGSDSIILCRCDSEEAISVGRDLGFARFQGRMIDRLLSLSKR